MKIIIAGTGSIGKRHIGNLQKITPGCEIIIIRSGGNHDAYTDSTNAIVVKTLEEALTHKPDALIIATPSAFHVELLVPVIENGIPVFVEKPVVTSKVDLLRVRKAVEKNNYKSPSMVGCNLRFLPSLIELRELVKNGAIGRIIRANIEAGQWLPDWRPSQDYRESYSADPEQGGGVIMDLIHEIDAARWLLGELQVKAAIAIKVPELDIKSEAVASAILCCKEEKSLVTISLDYVARQPVRRYELVGEKGTLTWDLPSRSLNLYNEGEMKQILSGDKAFDVADTYRKALSEFIESLKTGMQTTQPLEEGLMSSELAINIKEQACIQ